MGAGSGVGVCGQAVSRLTNPRREASWRRRHRLRARLLAEDTKSCNALSQRPSPPLGRGSGDILQKLLEASRKVS